MNLTLYNIPLKLRTPDVLSTDPPTYRTVLLSSCSLEGVDIAGATTVFAELDPGLDGLKI